MAKLVINENKTEGHINPEIYGHFSEHLGRCIYEGLPTTAQAPASIQNSDR